MAIQWTSVSSPTHELEVILHAFRVQSWYTMRVEVNEMRDSTQKGQKLVFFKGSSIFDDLIHLF